ncbi:amyloid beta A4 precursor protein-binding family B member 1-interacting protein-like [Salarias fasciatus]|uniref:Amyloid beta A4 precursor protein-binding family B member 1-interacting protein n=1 Tax=Salarias fasciatus TaxID=181472 RepID=A0A672HIG3_SALFA|nr:amyloid beta A4 precursor protein-binding family B member 1-interacting protein-like [Salarias fasciatus]
MDEIDVMFEDLIGEMDHLSQSIAASDGPAEGRPQGETAFSVGFTDLSDSLHKLEDDDLDALVANLGSKAPQEDPPCRDQSSRPHLTAIKEESRPEAVLPPPPDSSSSSRGSDKREPQTKADKIRVALEKLKEAKVRKMIIKVLMADGSSKILMVDERQTVGDVMDMLFQKTFCDGSIDWSLCETNPELQTERGFEDHEYLVEPLSVWSRQSRNTVCFLSRPHKYVMFTEPQLFYMWKKKESSRSEINQQAKQLLIQENFEGSTVIVPDLDGILYLKEDGKKVWKPRHFVLRASGIYYVPKGKTKSCSDLACFVRFENVNIYIAHKYKQKYRAPTDFCFILKHPCIQKESHYIKFLCCDGKHSLLLWANSIRIAKYGAALYRSYQAALKRASSQETSHVSAEASPPGSSAEDFPYEEPPDFIPPPPPPPPEGAAED